MDEEFLREYCERNKDNKFLQISEKIWNNGLIYLIHKFNFDDKTKNIKKR